MSSQPENKKKRFSAYLSDEGQSANDAVCPILLRLGKIKTFPRMAPRPSWLQEALDSTDWDEEPKWPDKVRRALLAEDAAWLLWRELHDPQGLGEEDIRKLYCVLMYFRNYPKSNDKEGSEELWALQRLLER